MRAVNLIPEELRPRVPGDGDPRVAYGVLGALAVLLVMVVVAISYSNKLKTIQDQTAAITAEAQAHKTNTSAVKITPDTVGGEIKNRTLLVGGLSQLRFPWGTALYDLTRSLPEDVTLDSISAHSPTGDTAGAGDPSTPQGATMDLVGCTSGWIGYSRLMTWLKTMPGVDSVTSNSSTVSPPQPKADGDSENARAQNCGPAPLDFTLQVAYDPRSVDLVGLPKPEGGSAGGATGGTGATTGVPAAATAPAPGAEG